MPTAPTAPAAAAQELAGRSPGPRSSDARSVVLDLLAAPVAARRQTIRTLQPKEFSFVLRETLRETGSLYGMWHDTPSGFVEDVIGETIWSKQREVLDAVPRFKRTAVPAGFGVGKTWLAGRLVGWAGSVNPPGTMVVVTTATRFRQVRYQLWPHIRTAVTKGNLLGECDLTQWKVPDHYGNEVVVAYGFTAPSNDEAAMQGIHGTPKLLLIVDEAGGISAIIGNGTNNLLTGDARLLAIGNPPMNDPGSWFERLSAEGEDPEYATTTTIRIAVPDSPAITGEPTPVCRACVPNLDGHTIAGGNPPHLPDEDWLRRTLRDYGDPEHPYVVSKVYARFPKDGGNKVMPASWVEAAQQMEDPTGSGFMRLADLGLEGETADFTVKKGGWVRLGVDVAAAGGDEFAIYRSIGDVIHQVHVSSGSVNSDAVKVAERVLEEIDRAERLAAAIGSNAPVRVKVDAIGLGWGVVGNLERWRDIRRHQSQIVGVKVSEKPEKDDPGALMRPASKRDEMWLAGRFMLQPDPSTGEGRLRLRVDHKCAVQLSLPNLGHNLAGLSQVERKSEMKSRGVASPDRAEAALLALYEPVPVGRNRRRGLIQ